MNEYYEYFRKRVSSLPTGKVATALEGITAKVRPKLSTVFSKANAGLYTGATIGMLTPYALRGISEYSRSYQRGPIYVETPMRNLGSPKKLSLGPDPFAGVRFARRHRNFIF